MYTVVEDDVYQVLQIKKKSSKDYGNIKVEP